MNDLCSRVLAALQGRTLVTAESCTGGGIGSALTAIPGSSAVYKGGVISYTNFVKENILHVDSGLLLRCGAVSEPVAAAMAQGVRELLDADVAVAVTGLAGPGGDGSDNPVGTVYIAYCDDQNQDVRRYHFDGAREEVRQQAIVAALELILIYSNSK